MTNDKTIPAARGVAGAPDICASIDVHEGDETCRKCGMTTVTITDMDLEFAAKAIALAALNAGTNCMSYGGDPRTVKVMIKALGQIDEARFCGLVADACGAAGNGVASLVGAGAGNESGMTVLVVFKEGSLPF